MTRSFPTFFSTSAAWISLLGLTMTMASCGGVYRQASALEDDELYLSQGEAFLTDEEYLSYAFEQAGFSGSEELDMDTRAGDGFNSNFGYVPQSLRGRSMLRGYMTPYGAAGFGPNPYDPYGSAFYGGYNSYDPYGSSMGWNNGWSNNWGSQSGWGMNPYMGYGYGSGFGYNPYASNPYGFNNGFNNGWGGGYNVYQGAGWLGGGESWRHADCGGAEDPDLGFVVHQQRHRWRPLADQQNGRRRLKRHIRRCATQGVLAHCVRRRGNHRRLLGGKPPCTFHFARCPFDVAVVLGFWPIQLVFVSFSEHKLLVVGRQTIQFEQQPVANPSKCPKQAFQRRPKHRGQQPFWRSRRFTPTLRGHDSMFHTRVRRHSIRRGHAFRGPGPKRGRRASLRMGRALGQQPNHGHGWGLWRAGGRPGQHGHQPRRVGLVS